MAKTRSDSVVDGFPEKVREQLWQWLGVENVSFAKARDQLAALGHACSVGALHGWFGRERQRRMLDAIAERASQADQMTKRFEENSTEYLPLLLKLIGQITFEASLRGEQANPELVFNYTKLLLSGHNQALKERKLELDGKQVDLALRKYQDHVAAQKRELEREVKGMRDGGLTPEGLAKVEEALKLL